MCSCENRGAGWNWSVTGTRQQKKMAEKKLTKKTNYLGQLSSSTTNQSTISQIFNQSGKMDYADVNDT